MARLAVGEAIVKIVSRRVDEAVGDIDDEVRQVALRVWSYITPMPDSIKLGKAVDEIKQACFLGLQRRGQAGREAVKDALSGMEPQVTRRVADQIMGRTKKYFPEDQYLALVVNTRGVFERRASSQVAQNARSIDLASTVVKTCAANGSRQTLRSIETDLDKFVEMNRTQNFSHWVRENKVISKIVIAVAVTIVTGLISGILYRLETLVNSLFKHG